MCSEEKIDQTFKGCDGVTGIADNTVAAFGKSEEEHELMHTSMKTGLKLIPDECKISVEHGIQSDPEKMYYSCMYINRLRYDGCSSMFWLMLSLCNF